MIEIGAARHQAAIAAREPDRHHAHLPRGGERSDEREVA